VTFVDGATIAETRKRHLMVKNSLLRTRKRGNYECIATWSRPSHASPFPH